MSINRVLRQIQVRIQPNEAIYLKLVAKQPGLGMKTLVSELDLTYKDRYPNCYIPDAYERLILDAIRGDQQHFVRRSPHTQSSYASLCDVSALKATDCLTASASLPPFPYLLRRQCRAMCCIGHCEREGCGTCLHLAPLSGIVLLTGAQRTRLSVLP